MADRRLGPGNSHPPLPVSGTQGKRGEAPGKEKNSRRVLGRRPRGHVKGKPGMNPRRLGLFPFLGMFLAQTLKVVFLFVLLIACMLLGFGSGVLTGYISTAQDVEIRDLQSNMNNAETRILDKDGEVAETLRGTGSLTEFVPFSEIRDGYLDDAFIAIEDERFDKHPGIDTKRIFSAVVSALLNGGTPTHGGSTITQQTIKLISGKDDISAQRKIQEWYNAVHLEQTRSKDSIMELYLNLVPMSNNLQGVQAASKAYFNKDSRDLSLAEAALIAGIPNRPATYDPMTEHGRRNCLRRMRLVLRSMLETGRITAEQYDNALNEEIIFDFSAQKKTEARIRNWFIETVIDEVQQDLVNKKGYSPELAAMAVYNYGLTIETTMDSAAQEKLEAVFSNESNFIMDPSQLPDTPEHPQAAITVLDNRPDSLGLVRAIYSGFGKKKGNLVFNLATDARRQPGSSIKPILVYAPALEVGAISQASHFTDKEMFLDPQNPNVPYPLNYARTYMGDVTLATALLMSLNTVAAETFVNRLGPEVGLSFLRESGIDRMNEAYVATALGGFQEGMSTWEMAGAYSVLANQGVYVKPTTYLRVLNQDGTVLLDNTDRATTQVYKPATCYVMTAMMKPIAEANWNNAKPTNTIAAGKTGTTDNARDVWFCGYTPYYTASVWYGYTNANGRNTTIPLSDEKDACVIWREAMQVLHEDLPPADFARPEGVINMNICTSSHMIAGPYCEETMPVLLIEGSPANPSEVCTLHDEHSKESKEHGSETLPTVRIGHGDSGFDTGTPSVP